MKRVLVFGVFDGFHPGHFYFLNSARRFGNLIVAVARDETVAELKGRKPQKNLLSRMMSIRTHLKTPFLLQLPEFQLAFVAPPYRYLGRIGSLSRLGSPGNSGGFATKAGFEMGFRESKFAYRVIAGDKKIGSWTVVEKIKPDVIVLGYDQKVLKKALEEHKIKTAAEFKIRVLKSYKPNKYHSSIIKKTSTKKY